MQRNSIEERAPVDFHIDGTGEDFIDLADTYLKVKIRITSANGENGYGVGDQVEPVNLILFCCKMDNCFHVI